MLQCKRGRVKLFEKLRQSVDIEFKGWGQGVKLLLNVNLNLGGGL